MATQKLTLDEVNKLKKDELVQKAADLKVEVGEDEKLTVQELVERMQEQGVVETEAEAAQRELDARSDELDAREKELDKRQKAAAAKPSPADAEANEEEIPRSVTRYWRSPQIAGLSVIYGNYRELNDSTLLKKERFSAFLFKDRQGDHYREGFLATDIDEVNAKLEVDPYVEEIDEGEYDKSTSKGKSVTV